MKRILRHLIVLISLVLIAASCEKEPFVTLNGPRSFTFSRDGGTQSLAFTCNRDWSVSSSDSWVQVSPSSGSAGEEQVSIRVSCAANNTYDARSATLTIKVGELTETVSISQDTGIGLLVSPRTMELTNVAQTIEIEVQKNVQYTVAIDNESAAWIKQGGTKALTADKVSFMIAANPAHNDREGKITFKQLDGNLSETVVVRQSEANGLFITTPEYSLSNGAHTLSIEVKANVDFEVTSQANWITYVETKALKSSTITLSILANEGYESRTGVVLVKQKNGNLTGTITVSQKQTDYLEVSPNSFDLDYNQHEIELTVTQNVDYSVVIPEEARDWVRIPANIATKGLVNDKLILVIDANVSDEERETAVTVKQIDGSLAGTVAIKQSGANGIFITTPEYSLSNGAHTLSIEVKANVDFEVASQANWITYVETKALKSSTITLYILANEGYDSRTGTVLVKQKNGDLTGTITVSQKQTDYLEVSPNSFDLDDNQHEIELTVTQNVDYSVVIPEEARDWVHIPANIATKGLVNDKLILVIDANDSDEERETAVTIKQVDGSLAGTVALRQHSGASEPIIAVDLGLSVRWASCNLGATKPEEHGDYYAWGETETYYSSKDPLVWRDGKSAGYYWPSYQWSTGTRDKLTKYCPWTDYWDSAAKPEGPDGLCGLLPSDDVAIVKFGGEWRMPTYEEWKELWLNCICTWTTRNGVNGGLVTSKKNGNSIFLPAAGEWEEKTKRFVGNHGRYWSSSLYTYTHFPNAAWILQFDSRGFAGSSHGRTYGLPVRPVRPARPVVAPLELELNKRELWLVKGLSEMLVATLIPYDAPDKMVVKWISSDATVATVAGGVVTAIAPGTAEITATCGSVSAKCAVTVADPSTAAFSVSSTKAVKFAPGNLVVTYKADGNHLWEFEKHQYDYNCGYRWLYEGTRISHFGWNSGTGPGKVVGECWTDWGIHFDDAGNGSDSRTNGTWYTLSRDEWYYLFNTRDNHAKHAGHGRIYIESEGRSVAGQFILPDDWVRPFSCNFTPGNELGYSTNTYTTGNSATGFDGRWSDMEAAGAVFLPAAGYRERSGNNYSYYDAGFEGYYWSSSAYDYGTNVGKEDSRYAYHYGFRSSKWWYVGHSWRHFGCSVRLVHD